MNSCVSMSEPKLNWDVSPKNGLTTFFLRENYKEHSMAPSLKELCVLANSPVGGNLNASASSGESEPALSSAAPARENAKARVGMILLPKPRVPYPRFSRFSQREQRGYVDLLAKHAQTPASARAAALDESERLRFLDMKKHVNEEVTEFLKFLQNSAKKCAQDYEMLSCDAQRLTEQILRACIEQVKKYPELYTLHEVTSLMGFFPFRIGTGLKLEKTLLALGSVKFVRTVFPSMPVVLKLSRSSAPPAESPQQIAEAVHYDISKDPNAEKLVSRYHPQIALTSQALFTLLNNHGPDYREQWEIPVCVQVIPVAGSKPIKVIYINSPLPQKKMTMRERNQIFHEIPLKCMMSKNSSVPVSAVFMDRPEEYISEVDISSEVNEYRKIETLTSVDLDFDDDVTELETFGVTATDPPTSPGPARACSVPIATDAHPAPKAATASAPAAADACENSRSLSRILMEQLQKEKQLVIRMESGPEERRDKGDQGPGPCGDRVSSSTTSEASQPEGPKGIEGADARDVAARVAGAGEGALHPLEDRDRPREKPAPSEPAGAERGLPCGSDTDEDCLVIDTECRSSGDGPAAASSSHPSSRPASPNPSTGPGSVGSQTSPAVTRNPEELCVLKKPIKRVYTKFDPVGQILKMQTELLKPISRKEPELLLLNLENSKQPPASEQASAPLHATSWPKSGWPSAFQKPKGLSSFELLNSLTGWCSKESVSIGCSVGQFPVYILPKVEYQACYGVEALTESELCRLWTESLLHSNCSFYVGHIDAFSSKLFLLEEITSEELKEKLSAPKVSSLFNVLQHILKKLSSLQEGSYLLSHAAEDSSLLIYKASDGSLTRTAYNLHKAHSDLPGVPSSLSVPWVPLDPSLLLPYHIYHGRIPCTFPPKSVSPTLSQKVGGGRAPARGHRNPESLETWRGGPPAQQVENEGVPSSGRRIP
ncbi:little elongation complex subunit 2 [Octodon degus]|uniref:Little elongation complex subunit 2 n=1 Tax=Octodon degus TaxID=10160 RepID=A0A6P3EQG8_OCTDE|nr:little elongation complex subunit 2 [Octodon degus]